MPRGRNIAATAEWFVQEMIWKAMQLDRNGQPPLAVTFRNGEDEILQRFGLSIPLNGVTLTESVELARRAEDLGYTDIWSAEVNGSDGFTPLMAAAAGTRQLRFGVAVAPAYTRPPALLAMTCASMQELTGGRFWLGIGSSSNIIVSRWMGLGFEKPLTRVRETVEALRAALTGEKVSYKGDTVRMEDFRLGLAPMQVPVMLAALGPKMCRLAGEMGDGVMLNFVPPHLVQAVLSDCLAGAAAAGKTRADLEVSLRVRVALDEDEAQVRAALRRYLTSYGIVPVYNAFFRRLGYAAEAEAMQKAWAEGRRGDAAAAVSDRMLEEICAFGGLSECLNKLQAFYDAGIDHISIEPISVLPDAGERRRSLIRLVEQLAQARSR